ncbi:retrovirus-related pol polyprotein from transposon tnt 1-94 [Lasius niger]|uniref:Retrovirus-related pol polyprotein from transposon tnt 1-94 n=1 Tax=Lasius niger TaxID=67767 RepID=A0A0J7K4P3_LASNI|nr:retrovirus-related pol polyprotein from transposon tnt 1-94 [Lasius niger]
MHVQDTKTAAEAWEKLKKAFEGTGLTRSVGILHILITTQLTNCASVNDYVNTVITTAHKLAGIGFKIGDEWIETLLLVGLPEEYKPIIMGLSRTLGLLSQETLSRLNCYKM